uniref:Putative secreted protein n=1 Tax=Ixodes ricinus TaxID=34613 RepID=A0A6B0UR83_IXORI
MLGQGCCTAFFFLLLQALGFSLDPLDVALLCNLHQHLAAFPFGTVVGLDAADEVLLAELHVEVGERLERVPALVPLGVHLDVLHVPEPLELLAKFILLHRRRKVPHEQSLLHRCGHWRARRLALPS